jgi:xylan 1,4-beta-xylosidase
MYLEERHEIIEFPPNIPLKIFMHKLGSVDNHWHRSIELLMVLDGTITISIDNTQYTLSSEDIILINSNTIHSLRSESAVMIAIQIDLSRINQFDANLDEMVFDCNTTTSDDLSKFDGIRYAIATMLNENAHNSAEAQYKNYSLSYYLVSELLANFRVPITNEIRTQQKYAARLTRLLKYIEDHYAENFTLSDLAAEEDLSVPYLSNFFEKNMGVKFSQYYTSVKLNHAQADLLSTNDSIETIAVRNGFTESHSFVRCFKKQYGTLPSAYRKQRGINTAVSEPASTLNYLDMEPSNYLHLLTKYLGNIKDRPHSVSSRNTVKSDEITASAISSTRHLKHTFKKFITVGRAKELLNRDIQNMLIDLQNNIGYEYIKFHGLLSDDMMVVSRINGRLTFHYTLVDMALDFLISIGLKPLIQLSFMPKDLAADPNKTIFYLPMITSPPKHMSEWEQLIDNFTRHLIERYGTITVRSWLFCVWNEPVTPKSMFGFGDDDLFLRFYEASYRAVKRVDDKLVFGSTSILYMENLGTDKWIKDFLSYVKKNHCEPEFLNVHYYSDIIPPTAKQNITIGSVAFSFPKRTDDFSLWIGSIKKIFASAGFGSLPIYMTEWNFTLSHRNLASDTCFKSCYIMKNLLRNYDRLDSFGYWSLTDLLEENALPDSLFHGGLGIYTTNGIRKSVYYSFYFASLLGDELIDSGEGYFITKSIDAYQIITYNYVHYGNLFASGELFDMTETNRYTPFDMSNRLQFQIKLTDLDNGNYCIKELFVNREYGSAYDIWLKMGAVPLDPSDVEIIKGYCVPGMYKQYRLIGTGFYEYSPVLEPLEIRFAEIKRIK